MQPGERAEAAFDFRVGQAELELEGTSAVCHFRNGDVEADGTPILEGAFHKTLPHDRLGQVRQTRVHHSFGELCRAGGRHTTNNRGKLLVSMRLR